MLVEFIEFVKLVEFVEQFLLQLVIVQLVIVKQYNDFIIV